MGYLNSTQALSKPPQFMLFTVFGLYTSLHTRLKKKKRKEKLPYILLRESPMKGNSLLLMKLWDFFILCIKVNLSFPLRAYQQLQTLLHIAYFFPL